MSTVFTPAVLNAGCDAMCAKVATLHLASLMDGADFVELVHPDYKAWSVVPTDWKPGDGRAVLERNVTFRSPPGEVQGWYALDASGNLAAYDKWDAPLNATEFGGDLAVVVAFNVKG